MIESPASLPPLLPPALQEQGRLPAELSGPPAAPPPAAAGATTEVPTQSGAPAAPQANWGSLLLPIALVFGFMWLFVLRPERKRQKERAEMLQSIRKGDKVVTLGGMHGEVVRLDENTITLKVDDGVRLKFDRSAVSRIPSSGKSAPPSGQG
ncbi:MAG: preprotein translocase subunit YajC [Planctomycetota bacterium]|nr:MAG: preprotein translocase subunit YajC [Planctomycetota bacterium]